MKLTSYVSVGAVALLATLSPLQAQPAIASTTSLTTLTGNHFELQFDGAANTFFGAPALRGNSVSFSPTNFFAMQTGPGANFSRATFNFQINLAPGYSLAGIRYAERGDFWSVGTGSNVAATGQVRVFDLDRPLTNESKASLTDNAALFSNRNSNTSVNWDSNAFIDLRKPIWAASDSLSVTIESLLLGYNISGGVLSFIEQKFAGIQFDVIPDPIAPVPEPTQWASLVLGLILVARVVSKKKFS